MTVRTLPRPRTFEDVCDRLEKVEVNLELVRKGVHDLSETVGGVMKSAARAASLPPMRDRESSYHDFDPLVAEFRSTLRDRVKDDTRFDSERARSIAQDAIVRARSDDKAAAYDALRKTVLRVVVGIAVGVVVAMTLAHFGLHP